MTKQKHIAIYVRVSSNKQEHRSQLPDIERWTDAQDEPTKCYRDKQSGKTMERPGWAKLEADLRAGRVSKIVVWRLDRLGRTASGLTALFERLQAAGVGLVSLKDSLDLSTPAGRLMANVLASVAAYESEVLGERVRAGQAVAKAAGKRWGGRKPGTRVRVTEAKEKVIRLLRAEGRPVAEIARTVEVSRQTVYAVLARQ
jgi:DNA invertase Pin-like site-specific DNA recombinase